MNQKQVKEENKRQQKHKKGKSSIILRGFVLGVAVYFVVTSITDVSRLVKAQEEYEEYCAEKQSLELDIEQLKDMLDNDSHKEIIEKAARERLGFVYSDEEIYIDTSGT